VPAYAGQGILLLQELNNPTPKITNKISNNLLLIINKEIFILLIAKLIVAIKKEYAIY